MHLVLPLHLMLLPVTSIPPLLLRFIASLDVRARSPFIVHIKVPLLDGSAELFALLHQHRAQVHIPARSFLRLYAQQIQRTIVLFDHVQFFLLEQRLALGAPFDLAVATLVLHLQPFPLPPVALLDEALRILLAYRLQLQQTGGKMLK